MQSRPTRWPRLAGAHILYPRAGLADLLEFPLLAGFSDWPGSLRPVRCRTVAGMDTDIRDRRDALLTRRQVEARCCLLVRFTGSCAVGCSPNRSAPAGALCAGMIRRSTRGWPRGLVPPVTSLWRRCLTALCGIPRVSAWCLCPRSDLSGRSVGCAQWARDSGGCEATLWRPATRGVLVLCLSARSFEVRGAGGAVGSGVGAGLRGQRGSRCRRILGRSRRGRGSGSTGCAV